MVINCNGLKGKDHKFVFHGVVKQYSPNMLYLHVNPNLPVPFPVDLSSQMDMSSRGVTGTQTAEGSLLAFVIALSVWTIRNFGEIVASYCGNIWNLRSLLSFTCQASTDPRVWVTTHSPSYRTVLVNFNLYHQGPILTSSFVVILIYLISTGTQRLPGSDHLRRLYMRTF